VSYGVSIATLPFFVIEKEKIRAGDARYEMKDLGDGHPERYRLSYP